jgi:hypothetical protein
MKDNVTYYVSGCNIFFGGKDRISSYFTPTLQKPEGFRVKASEGEVVVLYFESSATQDLKSSGFPEG